MNKEKIRVIYFFTRAYLSLIDPTIAKIDAMTNVASNMYRPIQQNNKREK